MRIHVLFFLQLCEAVLDTAGPLAADLSCYFSAFSALTVGPLRSERGRGQDHSRWIQVSANPFAGAEHSWLLSVVSAGGSCVHADLGRECGLGAPLLPGSPFSAVLGPPWGPSA